MTAGIGINTRFMTNTIKKKDLFEFQTGLFSVHFLELINNNSANNSFISG